MSNDRELLELAAKAAGFGVRVYSDLIVDRGTDCICVNHAGMKWNPLTDDGDALRLAVKLNMTIDPYTWEKGVIAMGGGYQWHESKGADPYAATRRAIVRAAAEIGRAMK